MEIKIQCDCGQRFKFDVEPANGRMPFAVNCPICGVDGTDKANALIHEQLSAGTAATPLPPAPAPSTSLGSRLAIRATTEAASAAPASIAAAPRRFPAASVVEQADTPRRNFGLSLFGVVLGAVLGAVLWHVLYRYTGWWLGFMALVTGILAGVAPQLLGHYRSKGMGIIAAFVTLVSVFTAQYLNAKVEVSQYLKEAVSEGYDEEMARAKRTVEAVPTGTDDEIRRFLAKESSDESLTVKPEEIEPEDIAELREELPRLRDLASGKTSKSDYGRKLPDEDLEGGFFKIWVVIRTIGIFNIVNVVLGVGAAYATANEKD